MKKGEIWRVRIPPAPGPAQTGERPAIIVQEDSYILSLPTVLIVHFTSTQAGGRFPGTLQIAPDAINGLTVNSVALVFQLRAVDQRNCVQRLGILDSAILDQIFILLDQLTGR